MHAHVLFCPCLVLQSPTHESTTVLMIQGYLFLKKTRKPHFSLMKFRNFNSFTADPVVLFCPESIWNNPGPLNLNSEKVSLLSHYFAYQVTAKCNYMLSNHIRPNV